MKSTGFTYCYENEKGGENQAYMDEGAGEGVEKSAFPFWEGAASFADGGRISRLFLFGFSAFIAEVAPLDGGFAAGPVVDLVGGVGFFFEGDEEVVVDFVVVGGVGEDPVGFFELVADGALVGVVGGDGEGFVAGPGGDLGGFESGHGALGVGADEAAGAEFDAAEVADDGADDVGEAFFFEDF